MHLRMSSGKGWPFCLGLNVLMGGKLSNPWDQNKIFPRLAIPYAKYISMIYACKDHFICGNVIKLNGLHVELPSPIHVNYIFKEPFLWYSGELSQCIQHCILWQIEYQPGLFISYAELFRVKFAFGIFYISALKGHRWKTGIYLCYTVNIVSFCGLLKSM